MRAGYKSNGYWVQYIGNRPNHSFKICPWKLHVYIRDVGELKRILHIVGSYCIVNDIAYKYVEDTVFDSWSGKAQQYKGITIYPKDVENFELVVSELDERLKKYKVGQSAIAGGRAIGSSGRLFYRYDADTKALSDKSFYTDNTQEMELYAKHYEYNRGGDSHLASDMTADDDIGMGKNFAKLQLKRLDKTLESIYDKTKQLEELRRELIIFLGLNKGADNEIT